MNRLIVIGWMGIKICYLNISREEAIKRYSIETEVNLGVDLSEKELNDMITEFEFTDSFLAYDAYSK